MNFLSIENVNSLTYVKNFVEYKAIKNRKTKIINHSPFIWVKTKTESHQERTKDGNDRIIKEFMYDEKDRIIETKSYNSNFNDENVSELLSKEVTI